MKKSISFLLFLLAVFPLHSLGVRKTVLQNPRGGPIIKIFYDFHGGGTPEERHTQVETVRQELCKVRDAENKQVKVLVEASTERCYTSRSVNLWHLYRKWWDMIVEQSTREGEIPLDVALLRMYTDHMLERCPDCNLILSKLALFEEFDECEEVSIVGVDDRRSLAQLTLFLQAFAHVLFAKNLSIQSDAFIETTERLEEIIRSNLESITANDFFVSLEGIHRKSLKLISDISSPLVADTYKRNTDCLNREIESLKKASHDIAATPFSMLATQNLFLSLSAFKQHPTLSQEGQYRIDLVRSTFEEQVSHLSPQSFYILMSSLFPLLTSQYLICSLDLNVLHDYMHNCCDVNELWIFVGAAHGENLLRDFQDLGCEVISDSKIQDKDGIFYDSCEQWSGCMQEEIQQETRSCLNPFDARYIVRQVREKFMRNLQPLPPEAFTESPL